MPDVQLKLKITICYILKSKYKNEGSKVTKRSSNQTTRNTHVIKKPFTE